MKVLDILPSRLALFAFVLLLPLIATVGARAATIQFVATDLIDINPGEDLWRYDYTVSGRNFLQFEFFDIYFSPTLYGNLTAGPAPNADWDVLALQQPNPVNLPPFDTGIFDAFALANNASLADVFSVDVVYLGIGTPGAQVFEIYDAGVNLVESGITSRPTVVPEPSTGALALLGLLGGVIRFHRWSRIRLRE